MGKDRLTHPNHGLHDPAGEMLQLPHAQAEGVPHVASVFNKDVRFSFSRSRRSNR